MNTEKTDKRRVEVFTMRLSIEERDRLSKLADACGVGAAAVIRDAVNTLSTAKGLAPVFAVKS